MSDTRLFHITHEEMCEAITHWLDCKVFRDSAPHYSATRVEQLGSTARPEQRDMFKLTLTRDQLEEKS